jgi:hypothetical protein
VKDYLLVFNYSFNTPAYMWYTKQIRLHKMCGKAFQSISDLSTMILMLMWVFELHDFPSGLETIHQRICPLRKIIKLCAYTVVFFLRFHICYYLARIAIDVPTWHRLCCFVGWIYETYFETMLRRERRRLLSCLYDTNLSKVTSRENIGWKSQGNRFL